MNDFHGFDHPSAPDNKRKPQPVLAAALVVLAFIAALLFKAVVLDAPQCAKASVEPVLNERLNVAVVLRGACCVVVGGGVVVTPTVTP